MISKCDLNIDELAQIFILSNTPYYLYKNFILDTSINKFSNNNSTSDLISFFSEELKKDKASYEDVVLFYSVIFALAKKPYQDVRDFFLKLNDYSFRWVKQISEIYFSKIISESVVSFDNEYKSELLSNNDINESNTNDFDYQRKPKIIIEE